MNILLSTYLLFCSFNLFFFRSGDAGINAENVLKDKKSFILKEEYVKRYFENGKLREEGWLKDGKKNKYWFFYYENGNKKEEGHFKNGKKCKWWLFYDKRGRIQKKMEFDDGKPNGYAIIYNDDKIVSAQKYESGKKVDEWFSLSEFKKDNPDF